MNDRIDEGTWSLAEILWNYHALDCGIRPVDVMIALGCHDERVATTAARHIKDGLADLLVTSGGFGKVTRHLWNIPEGVRFAEIARALGIPEPQILIEEAATHTGENITFTRNLLAQKGIAVKSGILVTKPYMRRRAAGNCCKAMAGC